MDEVLSFLLDKAKNFEEIQKQFSYSDDDCHAIIDKLYLDRLIKIKNKIVEKGTTEANEGWISTSADKKKDFYYITFEGKILLKVDEGYTGRLRSKEKAENDIKNLRASQSLLQEHQKNQSDRLETLQKRNLALTIILALTASVLCLIEASRFLKENPHFFCWH